MKSPKLFTKIAVLSFFIVFLVGFVAYRSGAFDKWLNGSPEVQPAEMNTMMAAQDNTIATIDSPPPIKTIMISGSKSGYLIPVSSDTTNKKTKADTISKSIKLIPSKPKTDSQAKKVVIPSSKSGVLIYPKK